MISNITQAKQYSEFLSRWLIANPEWENWLLHRIAKPIDRKILEAIFQAISDGLHVHRTSIQLMYHEQAPHPKP
jgi:hypothetical protein